MQDSMYVVDTNLVGNELIDSIHPDLESLMIYLKTYMEYDLYPEEYEKLLLSILNQLDDTPDHAIVKYYAEESGIDERIEIKLVDRKLAQFLERHSGDAIPICTFDAKTGTIKVVDNPGIMKS